MWRYGDSKIISISPKWTKSKPLVQLFSWAFLYCLFNCALFLLGTRPAIADSRWDKEDAERKKERKKETKDGRKTLNISFFLPYLLSFFRPRKRKKK